jgi:hypothetical protein
MAGQQLHDPSNRMDLYRFGDRGCRGFIDFLCTAVTLVSGDTRGLQFASRGTALTECLDIRVSRQFDERNRAHQ